MTLSFFEESFVNIYLKNIYVYFFFIYISNILIDIFCLAVI